MRTEDLVKRALKGASAFYEEAGLLLSGILVCDTCRRILPCPPEKAAEYLRSGWPACCGYTMTLATEKKR